jgi:hypothetical protein
MLVRPSVGPLVCSLVGWLVRLYITSKTDYVAIPSRLGFGVTSLFSDYSETGTNLDLNFLK